MNTEKSQKNHDAPWETMTDADLEDPDLSDMIASWDEESIRALPEESEVDHEFSEAFEKRMTKMIKGESRPWVRIRKPAAMIAACFLLFLLAFTLGPSQATPKTRELPFFFHYDLYRDSIEVRVTENPKGMKDEAYLHWKPLKSKYIPKGYQETDRKEEKNSIFVEYTNLEGETILYSHSRLREMTFLIDRDGASSQQRNIDGRWIEIVKKGDEVNLYWHDDVSWYEISGQVEEEQLIQMMQSISDQGK